jgi:hypothetical protein
LRICLFLLSPFHAIDVHLVTISCCLKQRVLQQCGQQRKFLSKPRRRCYSFLADSEATFVLFAAALSGSA